MEYNSDSVNAHEIAERYEKLLRNDPLIIRVHTLICNNVISTEVALKLIAIILVEERNRLREEIYDLRMITPKRFQTTNKIYRWDAPDDLIKIEQVT